MAPETRQVRSLEELKQVCRSLNPTVAAIVYAPDGSLEGANDIYHLLEWGAADGESFIVMNPEIIQTKAEIYQFVGKLVEKIAEEHHITRKKIAGIKRIITTLRGVAGLDGGTPKKAKMERGGSSGGRSPTILEFVTPSEGPPCYIRSTLLGKRAMQDRAPFSPPQKKVKGIASPHRKLEGKIEHGPKGVNSPGKIGSNKGVGSPGNVNVKPKRSKTAGELNRDADAQGAFAMLNLQFLQVKLKLLEEQEAALGKAHGELKDLLSELTLMGSGTTVLDFQDIN